MSNIELKPCPFCGGEAIISRNDMIIKRKTQRCAWVYCQKCGAKTPYYMRSNFEHYMRSAIEAWNRRADNKSSRQSCKTCKYYAPDPSYRNGDMAIVGALWLRVTGALDDLEKILPDKEG